MKMSNFALRMHVIKTVIRIKRNYLFCPPGFKQEKSNIPMWDSYG
jgi:hypothetical protein